MTGPKLREFWIRHLVDTDEWDVLKEPPKQKLIGNGYSDQYIYVVDGDSYDQLLKEAKRLAECLDFYSSVENRCAWLIDRHDFEEKYFKKKYIVDVMETEFVKDNGKSAEQSLIRWQKYLESE